VKQLALIAIVLLSACGGSQPAKRSSPASSPAAPERALYDWARPTAARLQLELDPEREGFEGKIAIDVELSRATDTVWLHADGLVITSATVQSPAGRQTARVIAEVEREMIGLKVERPLAAGAITLELSYRGLLRSDVGLFRKRIGGQWYVYSDFQPIDARRAFPCFDEPRWRLPWSLTIRAPADHRVFGNMPEARRTAKGDEIEVELEPTPALPSYLVAVAAGPFEVVDGPRKPVPLRAIVPRGQGPLAAQALQLMPRYIEVLAQYTQIPPAVKKLDLVAVPDLDGAMENHGLFTFNDDILLVPDDTSVQRTQLLRMVLAHEASHLWFGNLVGFARWEELWLSEGFATLMADLAGHRVHPEERIPTRQVLYMRDAMEVDRRPGVRTMTTLDRETRPPEQAFDPLSYKKGGALLGMIESQLGPRRFRERVRRYLRVNRGKSVAQGKLIAALAGKDSRVAASLRSFITQRSFPVIGATAHCPRKGKPTIRITQRPYRWAVQPVADETQRWTLPVCVAYAAKGKRARSVCTWLSESSSEVAIDSCPSWVFPLAKAKAYAVAEVAGFSDVDTALLDGPEHAALVASAWAAVEEKRARPVKVLSVLASALSAADQHLLELTLDIVTELFEVARGAVRKALEERLGDSIVERARQLGFEPIDRRDLGPRTARPRLVKLAVVELRDPELRDAAERLAKQALSGGTSADRAAVVAALETYAADLDPRAAETLIGELRGEHRMTMVRDRVGTLASIDRRDTAARVLDLLHRQARTRLFMPVVLSSYSGMRGSAPAALRFLAEHRDYVDQLGSAAQIRARFSVGLCTEDDLELLERVVPMVGDDDADIAIRTCALRAKLLRRYR
jgi:alanyl aminopeptidase